MIKLPENKKVLNFIYIVSVVVPVAVALMMFMPVQWKEGIGLIENNAVSNLPLVHAVLNGMTFVFLILAVFAIKSKKVLIHRTFMLLALLLSSIFLISYIVYHTTHPSAKFLGEGLIRSVYFFILISHIILSVPVIPLALLSIFRGWTNNIEKHKQLFVFETLTQQYCSVENFIIQI